MKFDKETIKKLEIASSTANLLNTYDLEKAKFGLEMAEIALKAQKELAEQFRTDKLEEIKMLASTALEFIPLFQSSLALNSHIVEKLENTFIKLPPINFQISLNEYTNFTNIINEFDPYKDSKDDYLLRTTTTETTDLGIVTFRTVQQTQLQVQSLQEDFNQLKNNFTEDSKKKDEMLKELLDYYRNGGTSTVKIKKVIYNKKNAELIIDDRIINIKAYTKQHYLCKVLFSSKASMKRVWEVYDIVEAMGEGSSYNKTWISKIYHSVRHLNEKIRQHTGIDRFIRYYNKTVKVNPKYLD